MKRNVNTAWSTVWAITSTAIALILIGVLIGKSLDKPQQSLPGTPPQKVTPVKNAIPHVFKNLPSEWHSPFDGQHFHGYAVLFDPGRREIIAEQCQHSGHFSAQENSLIDNSQPFCTPLLRASISTLSTQQATVSTDTGEQLTVQLNLAEDNTLRLQYKDHSMTLIPGSKNDLYQSMDNSPEMQLQKKQRFIYLSQRPEQ